MSSLKVFFVTCCCLLALVVITKTEDLLNIDLEGPNICQKNENYNVEVTTTELEPFMERVQIWCFSVPPRCTSYRIKHKVVNKTHMVTKTRVVRDCCDGYKRSTAGDACIPECSQKCQHGKCIAPEKCKCNYFFGGPACDTFLVANRIHF